MKAINRFFGQVYVINLKSRPDRRREMHEQLQRIGLGFDSPNVVLYGASKPSELSGFPTLGARGCFMSHLAVLRDARDKGLGSVLILEDDLNFCHDFPARFDEVASHLERQGWGMFHGLYSRIVAPADGTGPCFRAAPDQAIETTPFVAINGPWIDPLVAYLEAMLRRPAGDPHGGPMHVDGAYCWFRRAHPELVTCLPSRPLGYQRSSRTDVHALRWWDSSPALATVVGFMRRWRNRLRL